MAIYRHCEDCARLLPIQEQEGARFIECECGFYDELSVKLCPQCEGEVTRLGRASYQCENCGDITCLLVLIAEATTTPTL